MVLKLFGRVLELTGTCFLEDPRKDYRKTQRKDIGGQGLYFFGFGLTLKVGTTETVQLKKNKETSAHRLEAGYEAFAGWDDWSHLSQVSSLLLSF